ncbi:MAG: type II/IV secretion system ATPase subunit [Thermoplasmataceae archaeon]
MQDSGRSESLGNPGIVERYSSSDLAEIVIRHSQETLEPIYEVIEPELTPEERGMLTNLKSSIEGILPVLLAKANSPPANLSDSILRFIESRKIVIPAESLQKILYYIRRDYLGYGVIDPLVLDTNVEDISCDGPGIPIYVYHSKYQNMRTNVSFQDSRALDSFVIRLAQLCGKQVSVSNPILDGITPQSHRVQGIYGKDISSRGSAFTIRLFRQKPFGPIDLLNYGTADSNILAYLWIMVETLSSAMIVGPPGSGKTSTLNAILSFAASNTKIVSLEETRELNIDHPNWVPNTTRSAEASGSGIEEFSLFDLVRSAMRQRPTYIAVGEIRGAEAYALFQAMSTGHTTYSTIHADSMDSLINRLISEPMNIPKIMIPTLNIVMFTNFVRNGDSLERRITEIDELIEVDTEGDQILYNTVFRYDPSKRSFLMSQDSRLLEKFSKLKQVALPDAWSEFKRRSSMLGTLAGSSIRYRELWSIIGTYRASKPGKE